MKTKLFKKIFEANADNGFIIDANKPAVAYMSQETFVPLMVQMWAKTKAQYKKRYQQKALQFAEWCADNYITSVENKWYKIPETLLPDLPKKYLTTEELFEIWKKEKLT